MSEKPKPAWTATCKKCGKWVRIDSPNCRSWEDTHYTMAYEHIRCAEGTEEGR